MAYLVTARPVSGEIVAGAGLTGRAAGDRADVVDADYVEIAGEARPSRPAETGPEPSGMAMLNAEARGLQAPMRAGPLFWTAGAVVAAAAFWAAGGHALMPAATAVKELAPRLTIMDVRSRAEKVDGQVALLVDGTIRNDGRASGPVPALIVNVLSAEGRTASYRLGTLRTPLAAGAKYGFSSRLDMPKDGVRTVTVTFDQ